MAACRHYEETPQQIAATLDINVLPCELSVLLSWAS
jgi:hypothetical protein